MESACKRLFFWTVTTVGEGLAMLVSGIATMISLFCGILIFALSLVFTLEQVVPLLPSMPERVEAAVSLILAVVFTIIAMGILEILLIVVLALSLAALLSFGCFMFDCLRAGKPNDKPESRR